MSEDILQLEELDSDLKLYLLQHVQIEQLVFLAYVANVDYKDHHMVPVCRATEAIALIEASMEVKNPESKTSVKSGEDDVAYLNHISYEEAHSEREQSFAGKFHWFVLCNI